MTTYDWKMRENSMKLNKYVLKIEKQDTNVETTEKNMKNMNKKQEKNQINLWLTCYSPRSN